MNIFVNSFSGYTASFFKESLLCSLSVQHKKIGIIVLSALGCLAVCYMVCNLCFQTKRVVPLNNLEKEEEFKLSPLSKSPPFDQRDHFVDENDDSQIPVTAKTKDILGDQEQIDDDKEGIEDEKLKPGGQPVVVQKQQNFKQLAKDFSVFFDKKYDHQQNKQNQDAFKQLIQDVPCDIVVEYAKNDCFGIREYWFGADYKFQVLFNSMNLDQFKAFMQGTMETGFGIDQLRRFIVFIDTREADDKAELFDFLANLVDGKDDPTKYWQNLGWSEDACVSFVRFLLISALKDKAYENRFDQLHKNCQILCENVLEKQFIDHITIEEWLRVNVWALKNSVRIEQMPDEALEFHRIRGDKDQVIDLLDRICHKKGSSENISRILKFLLKEMSIQEIAAFAGPNINAFDISDNYLYEFDKCLPVINALEGEKLKVFLEVTAARPNFGAKFLDSINNMIYIFSNKSEVEKQLIFVF